MQDLGEPRKDRRATLYPQRDPCSSQEDSKGQLKDAVGSDRNWTIFPNLLAPDISWQSRLPWLKMTTFNPHQVDGSFSSLFLVSEKMSLMKQLKVTSNNGRLAAMPSTAPFSSYRGVSCTGNIAAANRLLFFFRAVKVCRCIADTARSLKYPRAEGCSPVRCAPG